MSEDACADVTGLPGLVNSTDPLGGVVAVVGDGTWLKLSEVIAKFRAAGFADSESTIRRMMDDGVFGPLDVTHGRHRRARAAKVEEYLKRRGSDGQG